MSRLIRLCSLSLLLSQGLVAHAEPYNLGAFRLAPLDDPWRIEFQGGAKPVTRQDIEQAVKIVGATRGWRVINPTEGRMEVMGIVREHTMSIELAYDATGYVIRYLQSTNLSYKELANSGGTLRVIHSNYNGWIRQDIEQAVKIVGTTRGWRVINSTEGRMEVMGIVREHTMSIELTYDATGYGIRYLQSTNLSYKELAKSGGTLRVIHSNYNGWIKDLVAGINAGLGVPAQTTIGFAPLEKADAVPFLREKGRDGYREFLSKPTPRAFAIAPNGAWAFGFRSVPGSRQQVDVVGHAMESCNRRGNGECKLYALDERVVWRSDR